MMTRSERREDTPRNEIENNRTKGENLLRIMLREINSLSSLSFIDLKSFFEGGNYNKKAMNSLPSNVRTNFFAFLFGIDRKITTNGERNRFPAKLCTGLLCRSFVDKFNDHSIH